MNRTCSAISRRVLGLFGAAAACFGITASAQTSPNDLPGMTYASLAELPDWSGFWLADNTITSSRELANQPPPFTAAAAAAREASLADTTPDPLNSCRPWQFTGTSGGFTEALEILFTPGRVTITNERGLIRRIYTDGRPMPDDLEFSNNGTSIGHWEGDALVIETRAIDPLVKYPAQMPGAIPFGENVVIRERIYLDDDNLLRFDVETVAPDIFTQPVRRTSWFRRLAKDRAHEISWCSDADRSLDHTTGEQRFDMTPPANLPPPPPR